MKQDKMLQVCYDGRSVGTLAIMENIQQQSMAMERIPEKKNFWQ